MNINATEELIRILGEIDERLKHLENSPNRAFGLVEYDTLSLFHNFNLYFKQFWDEFDRHSASQLLLYQKTIKSYSELRKRYMAFFKEQFDYLENIIDLECKRVKEIPPVFFDEKQQADILGYYFDCLQYITDEDGTPMYHVLSDCNSHSETIYKLHSKTLNDIHYKGITGMYKCLNSIYELMTIVCFTPDEFLCGYKPTQEEIICAIENGLRQYTKDIGKKVERDLRKIAQELKPSRNAPLTSDIWGQVMQREDEMYEQAIYTQVGEIDDKYIENISATKDLLIDNYSLLEKIKTTSLDGELFDIRFAVEIRQLLSALNADNLDLFYELVLRRNLIQCEMFLELKAQYEEWLNKVHETSKEIDEEQKENSEIEDISKELQTEEARPLWEKLREAGFIVADGYALAEGISNNQAAYIADCMAMKLNIKNKWKVFEQLWGIKNMAQLAGTWRDTGKNPARADEIRDLLK